MGAAGSISEEDLEDNIRVSQFCDDKLKSIRYIPNKSECHDATFPGPEGDESLVPQKYIWLQGVCAAFVMFTDMGGKTLPELWDSYAGAGFTEHKYEVMIGQAKQVMMQTLSPEIKRLINTDITESENQDRWTIAIGKVEYNNLCQAHNKQKQDSTSTPSMKTSLMYALTGEPDEEFPVTPMEWREYVFKTDLFVTRNEKWNGTNYSKEQLEKIVGHSIDSDDISYE